MPIHPKLPPSYRLLVNSEDIDPLLLMQLHHGQGDPVYALASRLYAYDATRASEEEIEAAIDAVTEYLETGSPDEDDFIDFEVLLENLKRVLMGHITVKTSATAEEEEIENWKEHQAVVLKVLKNLASIVQMLEMSYDLLDYINTSEKTLDKVLESMRLLKSIHKQLAQK